MLLMAWVILSKRLTCNCLRLRSLSNCSIVLSRFLTVLETIVIGLSSDRFQNIKRVLCLSIGLGDLKKNQRVERDGCIPN